LSQNSGTVTPIPIENGFSRSRTHRNYAYASVRSLVPAANGGGEAWQVLAVYDVTRHGYSIPQAAELSIHCTVVT